MTYLISSLNGSVIYDCKAQEIEGRTACALNLFALSGGRVFMGACSWRRETRVFAFARSRRGLLGRVVPALVGLCAFMTVSCVRALGDILASSSSCPVGFVESTQEH